MPRASNIELLPPELKERLQTLLNTPGVTQQQWSCPGLVDG